MGLRRKSKRRRKAKPRPFDSGQAFRAEGQYTPGHQINLTPVAHQSGAARPQSRIGAQYKGQGITVRANRYLLLDDLGRVRAALVAASEAAHLSMYDCNG